MKLNARHVTRWYRTGRRGGEMYSMQIDDLVTDEDELRAAIRAGMCIGVYTGSAPVREVSLAFLAPVISELRHLWVNAVTLKDVEVLNDARSLQSLELEVLRSIPGRVDLSDLPHFEEFSGTVTRSVASALKNPGLRVLTVRGAIPKSFAHVVGPVERFEQVGGRSQTELPKFAHPEAMRSISRIGVARFDLAQLAQMPGLEELEVTLCADVVGLSELSRFSNLNKVTFKGAATQERWEDLPHVPKAFLSEVRPFPSLEFLEERQAEGWIVPHPSEGVPVDALTVDEAGDEESWGVYLSRFDDIAEAVELFDGSVPGGRAGERLILGVVAELRSEGVALDPEPDSEGSFTAVYFPDQTQAERVYARAREVLDADAATQLRYLRASH